MTIELTFIPDLAQCGILLFADRLFRHGSVQIVADRTGEDGFIRQDEDKVCSIDIPEPLIESLCMDTARLQRRSSNGDRLRTGCHGALLPGHAVNQIFAGLHGNVRVSEHGAQGGVVAELHPCIIRIAGIIVCIFIKIVRDMGVCSLIDTV